MKNTNFANEVLSKGAILGAIMLLSAIFEQFVLIYRGTIGWFSVLAVETIAVMALYVWLLYRYTKRYSLTVMAEQKELKMFSYANGLVYVVSVSVLAGVIVALGGYLFRHFVIGYDTYIAGYMQTMQNLLASAEIPASMAGMYEQLFAQIESQTEPSFLSSLLSGMWSYLFWGTVTGLFIAAIVKREPNVFDEDTDKGNNAE